MNVLFDERKERVKVIHPLDDVPESKVDISKLGRMSMTNLTKWSLITLRSYIILMILLVILKVVLMAGGLK